MPVPPAYISQGGLPHPRFRPGGAFAILAATVPGTTYGTAGIQIAGFRPAYSITSQAQDLHYGSSGPEVGYIQKLLHSLGYITGNPSRRFGYLTQSAVMTFQKNNHIETNGIMGPTTYGALVRDMRTGKGLNPPTTGTYHILVIQSNPEYLYLYQGNRVILVSLTNTGIPQSPTSDGTYGVYLRYRSQTMQGVNPNGTRYYDPGVPWVNYFNGGDAVHGFVRASYGFPQSLGCVELPPSVAQQVYSRIGIGTEVQVTGSYPY